MVNLTNQTAYRLVNSKFPPVTLFDDVVSADDFAAVYAIQSLTNPRILNELGDLSLLSTKEIPFGIQGVNYVTAPFTHINPEGSRFSDGSFGVLYLADSVDTGIKESRYHQEKYFQSVHGLHYDTIDMRCLKIKFSASLVDCMGMTNIYHDSDYSEPRALGSKMKKANNEGFQYSSVRNKNAICWGLFSPVHVFSATQTKHIEFIFDGNNISGVREIVT